MGSLGRFAGLGLIASLVLLGACSKNEQPATSSTAAPAASVVSSSVAPLPPRASQALLQPAWLRERLPQHLIAYLRIPSAWGFLAAPNGRPLDPALASEPHARIVASLRQAIYKDKVIADSGLAPALSLLLGDLDSPIELVGVDQSEAIGPTTVSLVTAKLAIANVETLNQRLAALGQQGVPLLKAPLNAEGKGELRQGGFVWFDAANRRLFVVLGLTASMATLDGLIGQLKETRSHRMHDVERQIDGSGQGLFGWINLKGLTGIALARVQNGPGAALQRDFLGKLQTVAFGWGTVDGRGRLQVRWEAPQAKLLSYLAARQYRADIKTAGKPRWAISLTIPDSERLAAFENNLAADFGEEIAQQYREAIAYLGQQYGIVPAEWLRWVGPEWVLFEDASGRFSALRVNDLQAFHQKLDELAKRFNGVRETLKVGATEVQHLMVPGLAMNLAQQSDAASSQAAALLALWSRLNTHLYWVEDGPWWVFSEVPQALADRAAATLDTDLGNWLKQAQGYTPENVLFGLTSVTQHAHRQMYYAYLGGLQMLGDMLGTPVSLAEMPSAGALKLPVEGASGLTVDATPDRIGWSINYEQSPMELLLAGDGNALTGVMIMGIMAAVALPAYQDYTARAQVAQVLADSQPLQKAVTDYYVANGKLPKSEQGLDLRVQGNSAKYLEGYGIANGVIVLSFGDQAAAALKAHVLLLTPYRDAKGALDWLCGYAKLPTGAKPLVNMTDHANDILPQYLPAQCR